MTDKNDAEKKNQLRRLKDEFYARLSEAKQRAADQRRKNREFKEFWKDFLKNRGVPKEFRNINLRDSRWLDDKAVLKTFQSIIKHLQAPEYRQSVVQRLDSLVTGQTGDETVGYVQQRLGYDIFRNVTGKPYAYPKYAQLVRAEDIVNRNFLDLICKGIQVYKRADSETRIRFNKAVTPRVKKEKVVAPIIQQQRNVR